MDYPRNPAAPAMKMDFLLIATVTGIVCPYLLQKLDCFPLWYLSWKFSQNMSHSREILPPAPMWDSDVYKGPTPRPARGAYIAGGLKILTPKPVFLAKLVTRAIIFADVVEGIPVAEVSPSPEFHR